MLYDLVTMTAGRASPGRQGWQRIGGPPKSHCRDQTPRLYGMSGMSGVSMGTTLGLVLALEQTPHRLADVSAGEEGDCRKQGLVRACAQVGWGCVGSNGQRRPVT